MSFSLPRRTARRWTLAFPLSILSLALLASIELGRAQSEEAKRWDLTPLATPPKWNGLDRYQHTIGRDEFEEELIANYLPSPDTAKNLITIFDDHALIVRQSRRPDETYRLEFAGSDRTSPPRFWRTAEQLPALQDPSKPLEGLRIVVDPGHIGGSWAKMEHRWFLIPQEPPADAEEGEEAEDTEEEGEEKPPAPPPIPFIPVKEGEIVLRVGELLEEKLTALGARVALVRRRLEPVTPLRPPDFLDQVRDTYGLAETATPENNRLLRDTSRRLFYLSSEIRARASRVNDEFRPDLALCLHVNAESWGNPARPSFVAKNHFHILINGCYSRSEVLKDDQRFQLVQRILERTHSKELALSETIADEMAPILGLPAYTYRGSNAKQVGENTFVWSRNLLATRIYQCPVVFFEPYVMNHEVTHARIQAGEYPGTREILGTEYRNIYEEYADSVAQGVASYYRQKRQAAPQP